jgi:hypothetical protein
MKLILKTAQTEMSNKICAAAAPEHLGSTDIHFTVPGATGSIAAPGVDPARYRRNHFTCQRFGCGSENLVSPQIFKGVSQ